MTQATLNKEITESLLRFGYDYKQIGLLFSLQKKEVKQLVKGKWGLRCPSKKENLATCLEIQAALDEGKSFSDIASFYGTQAVIVQRFYHASKKLLPKPPKPPEPERTDFLGLAPFNDFTSLYFTPADTDGKILIYIENEKGGKIPLTWITSEAELNTLKYACEGLVDIEETLWEKVWSPNEDDPCKIIFPRYYENCTLPKELHPWLLPLTGIYPYFQDGIDEDDDTACLAVIVKTHYFFPVPLLTLLRVGYSVGDRGEIIIPNKTEPREDEIGLDADGWPAGLRFAFPGQYS